MTTKLITALRTTANALEHGTFFYRWDSTSNCNCGALFCALSGVSSSDLCARIPSSLTGTKASWTTLVGQHCPITGIPNQALFRELFEHGLTQRDIVNLEYLEDAQVVARIPANDIIRASKIRGWFKRKVRQKLDYENKAHVVLYMRAWADLLTEEGAMDVVEPTREPQTAMA